MLRSDTMSGLDPDFTKNFERETWLLYAVGLFVTVLRFVARIRRLGFLGLQADDYLMLFAAVWYTLLCVALNQVAAGGGSNLMTDEDYKNLTPEVEAERVKGSKWVFVSEHSFVLAIWAMKACMLVIYARITEGLFARRLVNYLAIYIGLGFVAVELSLFLLCRPLSDYWAVMPPPDYQCSSYQYYEIVQGCISISADIFMLAVAIPLMVQVRIPLRQKIILLVLFGMGIFVIVAAILNKIYCLVPALISYVYMNWYFREATVAILVTNLPLVWSLLRDVFPTLKSWTGGSKKGTDRYRSGPWTTSKGSGLRAYGQASHLQSGEYSMHHYPGPSGGHQKVVSDVSVHANDDDRDVSDDGSDRALRIRQDVTVTVERETRSPEDWNTHHTQINGHQQSRP